MQVRSQSLPLSGSLEDKPMSPADPPPESLIRKVPLFAALPPDETRYLGENLHRDEFAAGDILFREGEIGDRFSVILEGEVEVIKALGTPEERILAIIGPGDFLGEMSLLYRDRQRSASTRARTPVRLLEMTQADFDSLLRRRPELAFSIMQEMIIRMRNSEDATIRDLQEKNRELARAYQELKAAQARLIEQEKLEHELVMARRIQSSILPKNLPDLPGWAMAAHWQPARAVSGDFYDFIELEGGQLGILTGDVTGKGVPAALMMAVTRSELRSVALQGLSPADVLARVNSLLCQDMPANMFATCLYAVLDLSTGRLRFANAGHNLPYRCNGQEVVELWATGMPLGLLPGMAYEEKEAFLHPGETLVLYSDGLVEAHNPVGEIFGFPRLQALLAGRPDPAGSASGNLLIRYLLDHLAAFTGPGWEQEDDVTFVVLERADEQGAPATPIMTQVYT
jgi:serine phosphatase RsbU (regulator of sigma subunit)